MAITSDKLLNRPSELHRRYAGRLAMKEDLQKRMVQGGSTNIVLTKKSIKSIDIIKDRVIEIDSLLKGTLAIEKKKLDTQKRQESGKRREKEEEKLETKPQAEKKPIKVPSLPRMGFFAWVKNFIGNIILGYFAVRLVKFLPLAVPIVKFIGKATDFVIDIGGKLLDGLATFIDWGYKAYDATRGFMKNLFGEKQAKEFDKLSGLLNQFLNLALIVGMAAAGSGGLGGRGGGAAAAAGRPRPGTGGRPKVTTSGGGGAGRPGIRNPLRQRPTVTTGGKPQFRLPGTGPKITGSGAKGILSSVRPFLKRIPLPVVGALIDFGLSVALGENPGRAAFRAIGAGLLGAVGAAAGSVVPVAGNFLGGLAGGFVGDAVGGALYDAFFGNKKPQQKSKGIKAAGGGMAPRGSVTRGGMSQGGVKRTISSKQKGKYKRTIPQKPGKVEITSPGADIGGKDKLFGIFPNPLATAQKVVDAINPFKTVKDAGEELGKTDYFGPILAISSKITAGQKPSQQDYQNVGRGLNLLIAKGIQDKQLKGGIVAAFAEGGMVDPDILSAAETGGDISNWVAKTFQGEIESNAQKTLRMIRENSEKKQLNEGPDKSDPTLGVDDELPPGGLTKGQWGPLLDLIAGKESGGNYEAMYPRTKLPGATKMTIAEVARRATGAVGKYQQLPQYLVGRAKAAGLNPDKDLYSAENQEKIIINVNIKGRGGQKWLENKISDEEFMQGLSQEFASLPNAQGRFYYPGQRSAMTPQKIKASLAKVKGGGYSQDELARSMQSVSTAAATGSMGDRQKNVVELGKFIQSLGVAKGSGVTENPSFGGVSNVHKGRGHYEGRAIDIGGYGGRYGKAQLGKNFIDDQSAILAAIGKFAAKTGKRPSLLLHGDNDPGHWHHVHAEYAKGGETLGYPHLAMLGEKGKETVIDADSSVPEARNMLLAMNQATDKRSVMKAIQQYAPYDALAPQTIIMQSPQTSSQDYGSDSSASGGLGVMMSGEEEEDPFRSLYIGG